MRVEKRDAARRIRRIIPLPRAGFMPRLPAQRKARLGKETGQGFAVHSKNNGNIVSAINYRKIKEDSQYIGENNDKIAENGK